MGEKKALFGCNGQITQGTRPPTQISLTTRDPLRNGGKHTDSIMPFGYQKKGNGKERNRNYKIRKWIIIRYKSFRLFWSLGREELRSRRREAWAEGWRRARMGSAEILNEGRRQSAQEGLRSPERGDREAWLPALPPLYREERERASGDFVPDVRPSGSLSRGWEWKGRAPAPSSTTKWSGGLARGSWARGFIAQGNDAEPLGKRFNQTSPKGDQFPWENEWRRRMREEIRSSGGALNDDSRGHASRIGGGG
jgi:hypothetical protein